MDKPQMGIARSVAMSYDTAVARAREELAREGFGVLTEIDVRDTLRKKLDQEFRRYVILGACNPPLAHRALSANPEVGLLLPCNVIVYEEGEGRCVVSAINPDTMLSVLPGDPELAAVAKEARERLERAIAKV